MPSNVSAATIHERDETLGLTWQQLEKHVNIASLTSNVNRKRSRDLTQSIVSRPNVDLSRYTIDRARGLITDEMIAAGYQGEQGKTVKAASSVDPESRGVTVVVSTPLKAKRARPQRRDTDGNLILITDFVDCSCERCQGLVIPAASGDQDSATRKPIPYGEGSRDVTDVLTLTYVPTRPPMYDATGAEKLGVEMSCPSEASSQVVEMSCPSVASSQL